jgi:hypothetical protein
MHTVPHASASITEMESDTDSTLIVTSFNASITETNSTAQYSFHTLDRSVAAHCTIYKASFIYPWDNISQEVRDIRPAVHFKGGNMLLVKY